jgi:hypothetical protein
LLTGRKAAIQPADAAKENPLRRNSSDKKLFKSPKNIRNSATVLKSGPGQSQNTLTENKK